MCNCLVCFVQLEKGQFVARYCKFPKREDVRTPLCWSKPVFSVTMKDGEGQAICHKKCPSWGVHLKVTSVQNTFVVCHQLLSKC